VLLSFCNMIICVFQI